MNAETLAEMRRVIRLGIDRDNDEGAVSRPALLTAAVALFVAWFVITRPIVALAFVVGGLAIVGFVAVVGALGWLVFVWGADRSPGEVEEVDRDEWDAEAAHDDANGAW